MCFRILNANLFYSFFLRDIFGKSPELLQRLSECSEENTVTSDLLVALFYLPTQHLHEYGRLLLKLATCFEVVRRVDDRETPIRYRS